MATKRNENGFPIPSASGMSWTQEGECGYAWAVFKREDIQEILDEVSEMDHEDDVEKAEELAFHLSGWQSFHRGPGYAFAQTPYVSHIGRNRVLVKQYRGLDI